jgi:hypothetical protein
MAYVKGKGIKDNALIRHSAPPPDKKYIKLGALITYFGNRH